MKLIIDRFEENYAICEKENKKMININIKDIPDEAKEGDCLVKVDDKFVIDKLETKKRSEKIDKLIDNLFE